MKTGYFKICSDCFLVADGSIFKESTIAALSQCKVVRLVPAGSCLVSQGSIPTQLYCLAKGRIDAVEVDSCGRTSLVSSYKSSEVFPLCSLFLDEPTDYEFIASQQSSLCQFPIKTIKDLLSSDANLAKFFFKKACKIGLDSYERIALLQTKTASERILKTLHHFKDANGFCRMSRKDISLWTDLTIETVIRTLSTLEKKKRIKKQVDGIFVCATQDD